MIDNLRKSMALLIAIWTVMLLAIYGTMVYLHHLDTIKAAAHEARHYHTLNLYYRAWNANLGGVYADAAKVRPNPYLSIPGRDIALPDGSRYTLVNPAYMTRMVFDTIRSSDDNQIISKITSLKTLNPDNEPDQWEAQALQEFEKGGIREKYERTVIDGKPYLRFISPFITENSCLKCHGHQGYKAGDIRGGISIAVPLETHLAAGVAMKKNLAIGFFILWSLGVTGIVATGRKHILQAEEVTTYRNQLFDRLNELEISKSHVEQLSEQMSLVMNGIPALVAHVDRTQHYLYANRAYAEWFGLPQEEIPGKTVREVIGDEAYAGSRPYMEDALQGKAGELERVVMKSGEKRVQNIHYLPQFGEQGAFSAYFAFITDVTETKRKNALNASQLHLVQFAQDHSLDELLEETLNEAEKLTDSVIGFYHFVAADQTTLTLQNWSTRTKTRFCKADAKGMQYDIGRAGVWVDCVHQRTAVIHNDYASLPHRKGLPEGHAPVVRELVVPVMRGERITAVLGIGNKASDYTEEDRVTVSILADLAWEIVERKRTEEALRESNERFSSAFNNAPTIMAITSLESGRCLDVNQRFLDISGLGRDEVIGRTFVELGWITLDERMRVSELKETGRVSNFELSHRTKAGKTLFLDYSGQLLPIAGETYLLSIVQDVTEQRIMKQQLFQAQKMEAIGQLAGGIAHDFNNLLQGINSFAFLAQVQLKEHGLPVLFAEEIAKAGRRAAELTMGLLAFSRKQAINPRLTDVNSIIEDTHKLLSRVLAANIDFSITYHPSPLMVLADAGQIQQVLINLATNARDAMPGGGELKIATGRAVIDNDFINHHGFGQRGDYALFTIADSGHGMDGETRAHIFEPFYTTKEQGKGTGLGLAIAYGIVKQHNGFITVESAPGTGTTCHIYLPEVADMPSAADAEETPPPFPRGSETILIVDDEKMVRTALAAILQAHGYRVVEASDGNSAEEVFLAPGGEIGLVVMDIVMPQQSGPETLLLLRAGRPDLPALFISGYADDIAQINRHLDERTALLMKPVEPRQLLESVRLLLDATARA